MAFQTKYIYDLVDKMSPTLEKIQRNLKNSSAQISQSAHKIGASFDKMGAKIQNIGKKAGQLGKSLFVKTTLPIVTGFGMAIKKASDYAESINKIDVAFGSAAQSVKDFSNIAGKDFGIDRGSALDMAAMFGDMGTSMGFTQEQAAKMSTKLVGLAGDMSSFKNQSVDVMQTALASVFTGETESLKKLGTVMTEINLKEFARSMGIRKSIKNMTQAEKVALRYHYVLKTQANAIGDYKRTQEGFANQLRGLGTAWTDLSITLGTILLPIATKLVVKLKELVERFQALSPRAQKLILIFAALAAILPPILIVISLMIPAITLLGSGFLLFGGAITKVIGFLKLFAAMNPLGAFIMATLLIITYWDSIVSIFKSAFEWISKIIEKMDIIGAAKEFLGFGDGKYTVDNKMVQTPIKQSNINQTQQFNGQLDINFANAPKGTNMSYKPTKAANFNVGMMSTYAN